ncbi:ABC transporter permease subunit [Defluviimonas sp. SAOS-178_SWC]|uniref:ABC transporter permease subunit n=1 Tax=Defluviimonas sp. SAOS-178_SWC TaxID=3121287 RepID=UPI0032220DF7
MDAFTQIFGFAFQYLDSAAYLILAALGLSIIFGMMGVINMAHGELMMVGAYITALCMYAGVPAPIAILLAGVGAGLVGMVLERLIIRHFYKQILSSLVVTWGLSMIISQLFLIMFGPNMPSLPTPYSDIKILVGGDIGLAIVGAKGFAQVTADTGRMPLGVESFGIYRLIMFVVAVLMVLAVWLLLQKSEFGARARATMDNPTMANALGISTPRIYALTFGLGSALAGLAGGLFALTSAITPYFGAAYTARAFITVVVGGAAGIINGLVASVAALGGVQTVLSNMFSVYIGFVGMIAAAFLILLFMPTGISGYIEKLKGRSR